MLLPKIFPVTRHTNHVGPGSTFVAIKGFKEDSAMYVPVALEKGATTIVLDKTSHNQKLEELCKLSGADYVLVDNTRQALAKLSSEKLDHPSKKLQIIGITGTKGKSTTTYIIEHILRSAGKKTALIGGITNKILNQSLGPSSLTTPDSDYLHVFFDQCAKVGVEYVVMEVSSHALSLDRVFGIEFAAVGFTNLTSEHMDFYDTLYDYFAAKIKLFELVKPGGTIIVNTDDAWGQEAARFISQAHNLICFGKESQESFNPLINSGQVPPSDFHHLCHESSLVIPGFDPGSMNVAEKMAGLLDPGSRSGVTRLSSTSLHNRKSTFFAFNIIRSSLEGLDLQFSNELTIPVCQSFLSVIESDLKNSSETFQVPILGTFNAYNTSMATRICQNLGISNDIIKQALTTFPGVPGRLQKHVLKNGATAFVDFAHNSSGMQAVLKALRPHTDDLIVVFGCGGDRDTTKRPVMGSLAAQFADKIIITDDNPRTEDRNKIIADILIGIPENKRDCVTCQPDRKKAINTAVSLSSSRSIIAILGKGHETHYLINNKILHFDDFKEIKRF